MRTINGSDAKQFFASALLEQAERESVLIPPHGGAATVVLSVKEHRRLARLNVEAFRGLCDRVSV